MSTGKRILLQLLVFLGFFPYPAVTHFGENLGVQLGQVLAILVVAVLFPLAVRSRSMIAFLVLTFPLLASLAALVFLRQSGNAELGFRVLITVCFSLLMLPAAGALMRSAPLACVIAPVSLAICVHFIVGLWQMWSFSNSNFPFVNIFHNPSFADIQSAAQIYATYVKRPFGLFPEPSAMAAAIGPWTLFLLWWGLRPRQGYRRFALLGAACGLVLILLSQSLYAVFLLPAAVLLLVVQRQQSDRSLGVLELLTWVAGILALVTFPVLSAGRIDFTANDSFRIRLESLIAGISQPFTDLPALLFGIGPGQSTSMLMDQGAGLNAIYSVVFVAFAEGGLIALAAMVVVVALCLRPRPFAHQIIFIFAWVASVALSTSYIALMPVWLFLAMIIEVEQPHEDRAHYPKPQLGGRRAPSGLSGNGTAKFWEPKHRSVYSFYRGPSATGT